MKKKKNLRTVTEVICFLCKNLIIYPKCKAFDIIPQIIRDGENDHLKPLPEQDNNIVFEPLDKNGT
jgi:hypothetical protein